MNNLEVDNAVNLAKNIVGEKQSNRRKYREWLDTKPKTFLAFREWMNTCYEEEVDE